MKINFHLTGAFMDTVKFKQTIKAKTKTQQKLIDSLYEYGQLLTKGALQADAILQLKESYPSEIEIELYQRPWTYKAKLINFHSIN